MSSLKTQLYIKILLLFIWYFCKLKKGKSLIETFRQFQWFNPSGKDYNQIAADRVAKGEVNYRLDFKTIIFILGGCQWYIQVLYIFIMFQGVTRKCDEGTKEQV